MKMNVKGNDLYRTPDSIYNQLDAIFNFTTDVCCTTKDCKATTGIYFDLGRNALEENWKGRCFCNPPFSKKKDFIIKADKEIRGGGIPICVMILPLNCLDTKVFHEVVQGKYPYEILQGRIAFINPETNEKQSGNNSGTVIIYFKRNIDTRK